MDWKTFEMKFNTKWSTITRAASMHPKTAIAISLAIGTVIGYLAVSWLVK